MHRVVEEAANARGSDARRFGFQIQNLPDHPGFPKELAIEPGPVREQDLPILGDHGERKDPVARNVLRAAHLGRKPPRIADFQHAKGKVRRASGGRGSFEALMHGALQLGHFGRVADEHVQPGVESMHPMNEQGEVDGWMRGSQAMASQGIGRRFACSSTRGITRASMP